MRYGNDLTVSTTIDKWDPSHVLYFILDKMVDNYFPLVYQIEDMLNEIDENSKGRTMEALLEDLFDHKASSFFLYGIRLHRCVILFIEFLTLSVMTYIHGKREYFLRYS